MEDKREIVQIMMAPYCLKQIRHTYTSYGRGNDTRRNLLLLFLFFFFGFFPISKNVYAPHRTKLDIDAAFASPICFVDVRIQQMIVWQSCLLRDVYYFRDVQFGGGDVAAAAVGGGSGLVFFPSVPFGIV